MKFLTLFVSLFFMQPSHTLYFSVYVYLIIIYNHQFIIPVLVSIQYDKQIG
jgi:hypothetical protein